VLKKNHQARVSFESRDKKTYNDCMSGLPSEQDALTIRRLIIEMLSRAGSGHAGGALGMADVFAVLYGSVLQHKPKKPMWDGRDRVVLSNGHICPVLYTTLSHHGYFPEKELWKLRQTGGSLQGHPHEKPEWGIETSSGPLGQGLSQAIGMALAARLAQQKHHIFAFLSDGEHQEGQTWEAYMAGAKYAVENVTVVIDRNFIQISGVTEYIMPLEDLGSKLRAFGWLVYEVNGHDHEAIREALLAAKADGAPSAILAYTEPGRGVDFIENRYTWHGMAPKPDQAREALRQLNSLQGELETQYD
jgi:transketolase